MTTEPDRNVSGARDQSRTVKFVIGVTFLLSFLWGLFAFQFGLSLVMRIDEVNPIGAYFAMILGALLVGVALWYFYRAYFSQPRRLPGIEPRERQHPVEPWMRRDDWAKCRVLHTSSGMAIGLWIWTLCWWGFIVFIGVVNYEKIRRALVESWWNGAFIAIFVGAGLLGLFFALHYTLRWWRYGTSVLHLDTLPAYIGETFRGVLEARFRTKPRHPLSVELVCEDVLWVTSGHGNNRSTRRKTIRLGASSSTIPPWLITGTGRNTRNKIEIAVPADLPQYASDERGNGVRWVLNISTTGDDASFSCSFEIPVYARA